MALWVRRPGILCAGGRQHPAQDSVTLIRWHPGVHRPGGIPSLSSWSASSVHASPENCRAVPTFHRGRHRIILETLQTASQALVESKPVGKILSTETR
mmetsp:Transcript_14516/g.29667  ORF Transcript_14516/g.29667 Transcript_14516/m.29667 type:complete len:98 (+) Transcript_14516:492-785(+)